MLWCKALQKVEIPFYVFQIVYISKATVAGMYIRRWYYLTSWGARAPFVVDLSTFIKERKSSWCWASRKWDTMDGDSIACLTIPTKFSTFNEYCRSWFFFICPLYRVTIYVVFSCALPPCELPNVDFDNLHHLLAIPQGHDVQKIDKEEYSLHWVTSLTLHVSEVLILVFYRGFFEEIDIKAWLYYDSAARGQGSHTEDLFGHL